MASDLTRARRIHWPLAIALVLWALLGRACFARVEPVPTLVPVARPIGDRA